MDTDELRRDFDVLSFAAPLVVVLRKRDGSTEASFPALSRFYFGFLRKTEATQETRATNYNDYVCMPKHDRTERPTIPRLVPLPECPITASPVPELTSIHARPDAAITEIRAIVETARPLDS